MSSAYHDAKGWTAQYRAPHQARGQRAARLRIPPNRFPAGIDPDQHAAIASAFAAACDAASRLLESSPSATDVRHAIALGVISDAQGATVLRGLPLPAAHPTRVTLEQAYLAHPSSQRQAPADRWSYLGMLQKFSQHTRIETLDRLTLRSVQDWRDHLAAQGYAWDTRRHYLLPLRRCAAMSGTFGLPDVLGRLRLDAAGRRKTLATWSLAEICTALRNVPDPRARAAIALGAIIGLRPSEVCRIRCGDLANHRLAIGLAPGREHESKNEPSRRLLPIPPTVWSWLQDARNGRAASTYLITSQRRQTPFTKSTFNHWLAPTLDTYAGRKLPVKFLRKTFATWTRRAGLHPEHCEIYLGHETDQAGGITGRHYLADLHDLLAEQLAPTCVAIEQHLAAALAATPTATP